MLQYLIDEFYFLPLTNEAANALDIPFTLNSCFGFNFEYFFVYHQDKQQFMVEFTDTGDADVIPLSEMDWSLLCECSDLC